MKTVGFEDLLTLKDFHIDSIFAINQYWQKGRTFIMKNPRKQSAFLWFCGTSGSFLLPDNSKKEVPKNALVYIPQGSVYEVTFHDQAADISTVLIEFCLCDGEYFSLADHICVMDPDLKDRMVTDLILKLVCEYNRPCKPWLSIRRDLLNLLCLLGVKAEKNSIGHKGFAVIQKGIEYLQKDEKQTLSIEEIAKLCFVTPAYFRRIFREYAGMSPTEYRMCMKIERAKDLMERSEYSVAELSELLGYNDPSYFCRVFKKVTGMNPTDYQRLIAFTR